jgi:four helix bundle protein
MPRDYQGAKTKTFQKLYGYKKIIARQKADDLAAMIHELTLRWGPGYYRLSDQMRGAAISVKSNIAEGYCRAALGDYIRFCEIARRSLGELGRQIQDSERWGLVTGDTLAALLEQFSNTTYFLEKLIIGLKEKQKAGDWDTSFGVKDELVTYMVADDEVIELSEESMERIEDEEEQKELRGFSKSPKFLQIPLSSHERRTGDGQYTN